MVDVTIVVPCFNEADNVPALIDQLELQLSACDFDWEVIFVDDDSPDGTAVIARQEAQVRTKSKVRCIQRCTERGLASAVVWGFQAAHGDIFVVMDGDLQHDPSIIPKFVKSIRAGYDITIGTRFMSHDSIEILEGLSSSWRNRVSRFGNRLLNLVLGRRLSDPLSGFFGMRRDVAWACMPNLSAEGFKILFDILYHNKTSKVEEFHFKFGARHSGESKLEATVFWHLYCDLVSKIFWYVVPARLVGFVTVGTLGASVHFAVLFILLHQGLEFWLCQLSATLTAMTCNYLLNNILTYSDRRLAGKGLLKGYLIYAAASAVGIMANVGAAAYLFDVQHQSTIVSSLAGVIVDLIWRYSVSNRLIWKK